MKKTGAMPVLLVALIGCSRGGAAPDSASPPVAVADAGPEPEAVSTPQVGEAAEPAPEAGAAPPSPLDSLGEARKPEAVASSEYPPFADPEVSTYRPAGCEATLRTTTLETRVQFWDQLETTNPEVEDGAALLYRDDASALLDTGPDGERRETLLDFGANRLRASSGGIFLLEGYASRRMRRIAPDGSASDESIVVSDRLSTFDFAASETLVGFFDLVHSATDITQSGHGFWIARRGAEMRPVAHIDLGSYVVLAGRPFCDDASCAVVGVYRYRRGRELHAWMLDASGDAADQTLSSGDVYEATIVVADGAPFAVFRD